MIGLVEYNKRLWLFAPAYPNPKTGDILLMPHPASRPNASPEWAPRQQIKVIRGRPLDPIPIAHPDTAIQS